jgi:hypothetical protein
MSINSPESLPDDEPQEDAAAGAVNTEDDNKKGDGGVPSGADGVGLGVTHEANTFEPEEDTEAE